MNSWRCIWLSACTLALRRPRRKRALEMQVYSTSNCEDSADSTQPVCSVGRRFPQVVLFGDGVGANVMLRVMVRVSVCECVCRSVSVCACDARELCAQMLQDPRVLGAILINCHATAAGFLESRRDKVPAEPPSATCCQFCQLPARARCTQVH